jgi:phage terminase small subunit
MAISAKREDLTPKTKRKVRGANTNRGTGVARSRGTDTSNLSAEELAILIPADKPLTDKQKAFVKFWAQGESITSASVKAGYNDNAAIAYRMVKMPNILALKAKYELQWQEENQMTRKRVMDGMLESIEMAKLMSEPASMISGWREIGKICGFYAPVEHKVKVDVTGNIVLDKLNSLSDAELLKIISSGTSPVVQELLP